MEEKSISIREATKEDLAALASLMNELGYSTSLEEMEIRFDNISNHPDYKTFIVCEEDQIVGMAGVVHNYFFEQNGKYVRLVAFVISHSNRKKGLGKLLLKYVERWAKNSGATSIFLNCGNRDERKQAHKFYQKSGYQIKSSGYSKKLSD